MKRKETDPIKNPRSSYNLRGHPSLFTDRDYIFTIRELEAHSANYIEMVKSEAKKSILVSTATSIKQISHYLDVVVKNLKCMHGVEHVRNLRKYVKTLKQTNQWDDYVLPTGMIKELE